MARARAIAAPPVLAPGWIACSPCSHAGAAGGDERAFETIFRRYHQELYRYCLAIVRDPRRRRGRAAGDDGGGAARAARRGARARAAPVALPGRPQRVDLAAPRPARSALSADEASCVEDRRPVHAEERERLRQLVADLRALPDRQRSAILMRELSDLSYAEIAAALDCSEGAARQTVYEARTRAAPDRGRVARWSVRTSRRAISGGDRRRLRGRQVRTHLHACEGCRDFEAAIALRTADLRMLFPAAARRGSGHIDGRRRRRRGRDARGHGGGQRASARSARRSAPRPRSRAHRSSPRPPSPSARRT